MALRFPARTKGATTATGSLTTFSVTEPVTAGWRTFTKATSQNDLANGDTVALIIVDTTVTTGDNLLQVATATWNNTTKQFTIVQNYQPAAPPSWGAGTRDVVVIDNPALFLLLAGGTITGVLNVVLAGIAIAIAADTALVLQRNGSSAQDVAVSLIAGATGKSKVNLGNGVDEDEGGVIYDNATKQLVFRTNGADGSRMNSAGVLTNAAGTAYLTSAASPISTGDKMVFYQAAASSGWTKITTENDKALRVVSGGTGGTSGGSRPLSASTVNDTFLTIAQIPAHSHEVGYYVGSPAVGTAKEGVADYSGPSVTTSETGGSGSHTHTLELAYIDMILCSKN